MYEFSREQFDPVRAFRIFATRSSTSVVTNLLKPSDTRKCCLRHFSYYASLR